MGPQQIPVLMICSRSGKILGYIVASINYRLSSFKYFSHVSSPNRGFSPPPKEHINRFFPCPGYSDVRHECRARCGQCSGARQ